MPRTPRVTQNNCQAPTPFIPFPPGTRYFLNTDYYGSSLRYYTDPRTELTTEGFINKPPFLVLIPGIGWRPFCPLYDDPTFGGYRRNRANYVETSSGLRTPIPTFGWMGSPIDFPPHIAVNWCLCTGVTLTEIPGTVFLRIARKLKNKLGDTISSRFRSFHMDRWNLVKQALRRAAEIAHGFLPRAVGGQKLGAPKGVLP